ncbi:hypothetical protein FA95DRAFT_1572897 [Auriscalpium vulgare]|uniref:Uncharacterized protein n=1 Tax=Auriscalpium vulgare TaxID=40419 RepID=A0ACB8RT81_9AGAM|nr:hypothetical protein FA95DRAFT_1572897 [Auriscalpium vulgare]
MFVNASVESPDIRFVLASSHASAASMVHDKDDASLFMSATTPWLAFYDDCNAPLSCDIPIPEDVAIPGLPSAKLKAPVIDPARVYPSPPLTHSEPKRTVPLPALSETTHRTRLTHSIRMDDADHHDPSRPDDDRPSYALPPYVAVHDLPLSPPATLSVPFQPLPETGAHSPRDEDEDERPRHAPHPAGHNELCQPELALWAPLSPPWLDDECHADLGSDAPGARGSALPSRSPVSSHRRPAAMDEEGAEGDVGAPQDAQAARATHVADWAQYKASHYAPPFLPPLSPTATIADMSEFGDQAGPSTGHGTLSFDSGARAFDRPDSQASAKHPLSYDAHPVEDSLSPLDSSGEMQTGFPRAEKRMRYYSEGQVEAQGFFDGYNEGATTRRSFSAGTSHGAGPSRLLSHDLFPSPSSLTPLQESESDFFLSSPAAMLHELEESEPRESLNFFPSSPRHSAGRLPGLFGDDDAMDVDDSSLSSFQWDPPPPSSPRLSGRLDLFADDFNDIEGHSPSSPSRRYTAPLPEGDDILMNEPGRSYSPPGSPRLLSFPGVETDDDLIQVERLPSSEPSINLNLSPEPNSLGLTVPIAPASDAAELVDERPPNLDFSTTARDRGDPEQLENLFAFRRRTWNAEREWKRKQVELAGEARRLAVPLQANILVPGALNISVPGTLPDFDERGWASGDVPQDVLEEPAAAAQAEEDAEEAQRAHLLALRRRELQITETQRAVARDRRRALKERGREIDGLLTLKLKETPESEADAAPSGPDAPTPTKPPSGPKFTSMPNLVASMTLKRRNSQRPLTRRKTARSYSKSSLSHSDEKEEKEEDDDEMEE